MSRLAEAVSMLKKDLGELVGLLDSREQKWDRRFARLEELLLELEELGGNALEEAKLRNPPPLPPKIQADDLGYVKVEEKP